MRHDLIPSSLESAQDAAADKPLESVVPDKRLPGRESDALTESLVREIRAALRPIRDLPDVVKQEAASQILSGNTIVLEFPVRAADGGANYYAVTLSTGVDANEERINISLSSPDSPRKTTNATLDRLNLLNTVFEASPSAILITDSFRRLLHCNPKASQLFGFSSRHIGQGLAVSCPSLGNILKNAGRTTDDFGEFILQKQKMLIHGEMQYFDIIAYPFRFGDIQGQVLRIDDISLQVRLEELIDTIKK